jgi:hypothetical protein
MHCKLGASVLALYQNNIDLSWWWAVAKVVEMASAFDTKNVFITMTSCLQKRGVGVLGNH